VRFHPSFLLGLFLLAPGARAEDTREPHASRTGLLFEAALGGGSSGFAASTGVLARWSILEGGFFISARTYLLGASSIGFTPTLGVSLPLGVARVELLGVGGLHQYVGCQDASVVQCVGPQAASGDRAFLGGWAGVTLPLKRSLPPYIGVWVFLEGDLDQRSVLAQDGTTELALGGWQLGAALRGGFDFLAR
jgi:hypothetical protein